VKSGPPQAATACRSIAILRNGAGFRRTQHGRVNAGFFCLSRGPQRGPIGRMLTHLASFPTVRP